MSDEIYMMGITVKETIGVLMKLQNHQSEIIASLQERVLDLEEQVRCTHLFTQVDDYLLCAYCEQSKRF